MRIEEFLSRTRRSGECWIWTRGRTTAGYGVFRYRRELIYAHRWSYEHYKSAIKPGLEIDHLCRNRACVNPDHLEAVTHKENVRRGGAHDYWKKKTHCPRGHAYDEVNTYHYAGRRFCRTCRREAVRRHYANRRSPLPTQPEAD